MLVTNYFIITITHSIMLYSEFYKYFISRCRKHGTYILHPYIKLFVEISMYSRSYPNFEYHASQINVYPKQNIFAALN
jgi:hypothetical protein